MKKFLITTIIALVFSPIVLVGRIFAQDPTISARVVSVETPIITAEPEFTNGLENAIYWSEADLAVEYYAEVSTDGTFGMLVANTGWIVERTYTFVNLDDDTKYYYRVKAKNAIGGEGEWSEVAFSTQDDNAPTSRALELPETSTTASFDIDIEYFDQTSGVAEITLYYKKDDGAWTAYSTFSAVNSILFNTLLTGGDGNYSFYTVAIDVVNNVEYEILHVDATTIVDTTVPTPIQPIPVTPTPTPIPTPTYFVFIHTVSDTYVKEATSVTVFDIRLVVKGYASPLKKLDWTLKNNSVLVSDGYIRSGEDEYWEVELPDLSVGVYDFEISFTQGGTRYSDEIRIQIVNSRQVSIKAFAFPGARVFAYFNDRQIDLGIVEKNGILLTTLEIPVGFSGEMIFLANKDLYKSEYKYYYQSDTEKIDNIVFPPIIYTEQQRINLGQTVTISGYAFPNASLKIFVNNELVAETTANDEGEFECGVSVFFNLKQYIVTAMQTVNEVESPLSSPVTIFVSRFAIPYFYKVGSLVNRQFAYFAQMVEFISSILVLISFSMTLMMGLLLASATTIAGYYYMLQDWLAFTIGFAKRRKKLKIQVWGVDFENKEGILYLNDKTTEELRYRVVIDRTGIGHLPRIEGHYLLRFIPTRNKSWMKTVLYRKQQVFVYFNDEFSIRTRDEVVNVTFDSMEEIFIYPFKQFEKHFDRIIGFIVLPISFAAIVATILSFYFNAEYSSLLLIVFSIILLTVNILFMGVRKDLHWKVNWEVL